MPSPAPALLQLRAQLDERWPTRSRASDGIMGDARHRGRKSDHNEGNALDITHDPSRGPDLERLVHELVRQMKANPQGGRLSYIIWRRRIWSGPAWRRSTYYGLNAHTSHAHFSVKASHRNVARPWTLYR